MRILTLALAGLGAVGWTGAVEARGAVPVLAGASGLCSALVAAPPDYYAIDLVPTSRVPGTGNAVGTAALTYARSPFGVSLSPTGTYAYDVDVEISGVRPRRNGAFVVWGADAELSEVVRFGVLDESFRIAGRVSWNKFLVIVSFEASGAPADRWQGPIVMRGMSRSGAMHTMAGHGPYQSEACAKYGYR